VLISFLIDAQNAGNTETKRRLGFVQERLKKFRDIVLAIFAMEVQSTERGAQNNTPSRIDALLEEAFPLLIPKKKANLPWMR